MLVYLIWKTCMLPNEKTGRLFGMSYSAISHILSSMRSKTKNEKGTLHCICPASGEQRDMAFRGFEADRNTLKYRCPAAAYGFQCQGHKECSAFGQVNPAAYGRSIRINITKEDRRIFTPTPHGSPSWQRIYNRRSSLERINNRIDNSFGFEKHYIRGKAKMHTRVGLAISVMMAMALGHARASRIGQSRSLVRPADKAA